MARSERCGKAIRMCGIAGAFSGIGARPFDRRTLIAMLAAVRHRGPDGCGIFIEGHAAIGAVRLGITDIQRGEQPFVSSCGNVLCCYNGEIFNYIELRRTLAARGFTFKTDCDGEVIANLYSHGGRNALARLEGQFSVALWDRRNQTGVLVRDEFGILPLYFVAQGGQFFFASSLAAFYEISDLDLSINSRALDDVCTFWTPVGRNTFLTQVLSVLPGEMITIHSGTWKSETRRFQVPSHREIMESRGLPGPDIASLFREAVTRRIPTDVPWCVYLSGGVDSTLVAQSARQCTDTVTALSVTFPGSRRDEEAEQVEIARALGLRHLAIPCTRADIAHHFEAVVKYAETPLVRTAPVGTFLLSRLAQDAGIKVALTGEGADEIFGGYDIYRSIRFIDRLRAASWSADAMSRSEIDDWMIRDPFASVLPADRSGGTLDALLLELKQMDLSRFGPHLVRWTRASALACFLDRRPREAFNVAESIDNIRNYLPPDYDEYDAYSKAALLDFNTLLAGYLLSSQGDRMAMAHSVELRVPFLDRTLVQSVWRQPPERRFSEAVTKPLLRSALDPSLPNSIRSRTKKAYAAMDLGIGQKEGWSIMEPYLSAEMCNRFGLFDGHACERMVHAERASNAYSDDFVSPLAFIASTHILAHHFTALSARGPGVGVPSLRPGKELVGTRVALSDLADVSLPQDPRT